MHSAVGGRGVNSEEIEKKKMHDELRSLVDKYELMAKRMGSSSSVEQFLTRTDHPYSEEVMAIPLLAKFKVPQIDLYDRSKNPIDHLKNFKAHMTFHGFPGEVACRLPIYTKGNSAGMVQDPSP